MLASGTIEGTIRTGESWRDIAGGHEIPDHHVSRVLTFLGSTVEGDLIHTTYTPGSPMGEEEDVVERMVLVGADGAGRRLRRRRFEVGADELLIDVDAIYLCQATGDRGQGVRYVIVDIRPRDDIGTGSSDAVLVCRHSEFKAVAALLKVGGSGGSIWRGASLEESSPILSLHEENYVFDPALLSRLRHETVGFLRGDVAETLRNWGVPPKNGIVLYGEPGNGKTILTRICAKYALEAGMDVAIIEGRRQSRVSRSRDVLGIGDELRRAAARSPALLIFEDIDLHCQKRGASDVGAANPQAESQQPLAEILDFLDGVEPTDGYVLLASTNVVKDLDQALIRPGRIDVTVEVQQPTAEQRAEALARMVDAGPQPVPDPSRAADLLVGVSFAALAEVSRRYKVAAAHNPKGSSRDQLEQAAEAFMREREQMQWGEADLPEGSADPK